MENPFCKALQREKAPMAAGTPAPSPNNTILIIFLSFKNAVQVSATARIEKPVHSPQREENRLPKGLRGKEERPNARRITNPEALRADKIAENPFVNMREGRFLVRRYGREIGKRNFPLHRFEQGGADHEHRARDKFLLVP